MNGRRFTRDELYLAGVGILLVDVMLALVYVWVWAWFPVGHRAVEAMVATGATFGLVGMGLVIANADRR